MGFTLGPPVGDFEFGNESPSCTFLEHIIFRPDQTPKYVLFSVDDVPKYIIKQSVGFPNQWRTTGFPEGRICSWNNTANTVARIFWFVFPGPVVHRSFDYTDPPRCLTRYPNQEASGDREGDVGSITWGTGIDEAAFLAQF